MAALDSHFVGSDKLAAVLLRDLQVRKTWWFLTLLEVLMPNVIFMAMSMVNTLEYNRLDYGWNNNTLHGSTVLFAPGNWFTARMMRQVEKTLHVDVKPFANEKMLMNFYSLLDKERRHTYGVVFEGSPSAPQVPLNMSYKIFVNQEEGVYIIPRERNSKKEAYSLKDILDVSLNPHFSAIQLTLDRAFINLTRQDEELPKVILQKEGSPGVKQITPSSGKKLPEVMVVLSMTVLAATIFMRTVHEKESGLKGLMKIMGLPSWILSLSVLMESIIISMFTMSIMVICLLKPWNGVTSHVARMEITVMWAFLVLYATASQLFCYLLSSFFSNTKIAVTFGIVIWWLTYFLPQKIVMGCSMRLFSCLLPNMALNWGFTVLFAMQDQGIHVNWTSIFIPAGDHTGIVCLACVLSLLLSDVVVFTLIAVLFEILWSNGGASRPWYFMFFPCCWTRTKTIHGNRGASAGIRMQNLTKVFVSLIRQERKIAVDSITADICKGDITVLLGLNGSGKSTIVSLVTGLTLPTRGTVYVNGHDVQQVPPLGMGVCFQHNLYFPELTVAQNFLFFAVIKDIPVYRAREEAYSYIIRLRLADKCNKLVGELSAGQKRKVALGLALVGNPKILVLDEPTLGMDPEAKREIWDLLLSLRGRHQTTLVATHDAEEADVLADRIAILDHGKIHCYGTASYLKQLYGNSFKLTLIRKREVVRVQDTVEQCILGAKCYSEKSLIQSFSLPAECSAQFPELFDQLQQNRKALCIESIRLTTTTLEDVLIRIRKTYEEEENSPKSPDSLDSATFGEGSEELDVKKKAGNELQMLQLSALFTKKTIFTCRNWINFLLHVLIITLTVSPLIITSNINKNGWEEFSRVLSLEEYGPVDVLCEAQPDTNKELVKKFKSLITPSNSSEGLLVNGSVPTEDFIAVEFGKDAVNMLCTQKTAGVAVNLIGNAILLPDHAVKTMSQAFSRYKTPGKLLDMIVEAAPLMLLSLCLQFIIQGCLIFPMLERVFGMKHLQNMTGIKPIVYWATCFAVDLVVYLTLCIIVLELLALCGNTIHLMIGLSDLCPYILLFIAYACAGLPYTYILSLSNNMTSYSASYITLWTIFMGLIVPVALFVIKTSHMMKYTCSLTFVRYIFEFFPPCAFMLGYMSLMDQQYNESKCKVFHSMNFSCVTPLQLQDICCCEGASCHKSYLSFPTKGSPRGIGEELTFLIIDALLYWVVLLILESRLFFRLRRGIFYTSPHPPAQDIGVMKEQDKIETQYNSLLLKPNEDDLLVYKLMKQYYETTPPAVKGVSFSIGPGQCFGLLGVNGAGKTSMLKLIVGQDYPTEGDVWVNQWNLTRGDDEYYMQLGYSPEVETFYEQLTGREMLQLFAKLRGIREESERNQEVDKWLFYFGLQDVANHQCSTYSISDRRKMNFALATIGEPRLLVLDNPTKGIDIVAKRNIWNVLSTLRNSGQSILITTHSMAECEALCTRIGMLEGGQMVCLGDLGHIRKSLAQGIVIIIKLRLFGANERQVARLKAAFEEYLQPSCIQRCERQGYLHYHIVELNTSWKMLFAFMEHIKQEHKIVEHYSISETPELDDAFLSFARIEPQYIENISNV